MSLSGGALIDAVAQEHGIRLVENRGADGFKGWCRRNKRLIILAVGLFVVPLSAIVVYAYLRHGLGARMLWMPALFLLSYAYHRFGLRYLSGEVFWLGVPLTFYLVSPYMFDDVAKYDPLNPGVDYPHMSGLAVSLALGFGMVIFKSLDGNSSESLADMVRNRFTTLRKSAVLVSVVTVTAYTAYLLHAYVLYQIFVEGHWQFAILLVFGVVAFAEFLLSLMRR